MTAQIPDLFQYRNAKYTLAGISEGELFDISAVGLKPSMASTACWRGYQAIYSISESCLVLDTLHANLVKGHEPNMVYPASYQYEPEQGPPINGISPSSSNEEARDFLNQVFNNHYIGLDYRLTYSGGVLLADGFIKELYVHMGFHPAWKYERVVELIFEKGVLKEEFDRSALMAEIREKVITSPTENDASRKSMPDDEIAQFVKRAFDRTYRM